MKNAKTEDRVGAVLYVMAKNYGTWFTANAIASSQGVSKRRANEVLWRAGETGFIERRAAYKPNGVQVFEYALDSRKTLYTETIIETYRDEYRRVRLLARERKMEKFVAQIESEIGGI